MNLMNNQKLRNILLCTIILTLIASNIYQLDKIWADYALFGAGWLFFTGLANDIVDRLSGHTKQVQKYDGKKFELVSFNDAVSDELMKIRCEINSIKVRQDKLGWDKISDDFLVMFWTYKVYPAGFICAYLETPEDYVDSLDKYQGKIIIVLDKDIDINDNGNINFDNETLRKIKSYKVKKIKSGMSFTVFIAENKNEETFSTSPKYAKILSITEKCYGECSCYLLTLEINTNSIFHPSLELGQDDDEDKGKVIRKIKIFDFGEYNYHFVTNN